MGSEPGIYGLDQVTSTMVCSVIKYNNKKEDKRRCCSCQMVSGWDFLSQENWATLEEGKSVAFLHTFFFYCCCGSDRKAHQAKLPKTFTFVDSPASFAVQLIKKDHATMSMHQATGLPRTNKATKTSSKWKFLEKENRVKMFMGNKVRS